MSTHPVIEFKGVTKAFGSKLAVANLDLAVNRGEVYGFLGPNGAGKTTSIRLLLDVLRPSSGEVRIFGESNRNTVSLHSRIGFLSGEMALDGDLTGRQYLSFVGNQYGGPWQKSMVDLAKRLDLDLSVKIGASSRGNRQKIGLVSALMHKSELLILDEPTSGFDPLVQETFMTLVREYREAGGTVFMSSHILSEVQQLCDRVAFIKDGKLVGVRTLADLQTSATKRVTVRASSKDLTHLIAAAHTLTGLAVARQDEDMAVLSYAGEITPLLKFLAATPISDVTIVEPELEEVFIGYYRDAEEVTT